MSKFKEPYHEDPFDDCGEMDYKWIALTFIKSEGKEIQDKLYVINKNKVSKEMMWYIIKSQIPCVLSNGRYIIALDLTE